MPRPRPLLLRRLVAAFAAAVVAGAVVQHSGSPGTQCSNFGAFLASDGCSTCFCSGDGRMTYCSRQLCPEPRGNYSIDECVEDALYSAMDGCNRCQCNAHRRFSWCTRRACTAADGATTPGAHQLDDTTTPSPQPRPSAQPSLTSPTSPTSPTQPTSVTSPTQPTSAISPTQPTSATSPTQPTSPPSPSSPPSRPFAPPPLCLFPQPPQRPSWGPSLWFTGTLTWGRPVAPPPAPCTPCGVRPQIPPPMRHESPYRPPKGDLVAKIRDMLQKIAPTFNVSASRFFATTSVPSIPSSGFSPPS